MTHYSQLNGLLLFTAIGRFLHFPVGTYFLNGNGQGGAAAVHVAVNRESDIPGRIGKLPFRSVEENSVTLHDALAHEKLQMIGSHADRKSTRLNSSHSGQSRMPSSA